MTANKKVEIKVSGMACAACSAAVERSLQNLDGIISAAVNLAAETALIEYDPERLNLADLEKAIKDAGYDVVDDEVVLNIGGMSCAMCVAALQKALLKLDGVVEARVNLASEKAYVIYNSRLVGLPEMKKAVVDAGYQFLGLAGEEGAKIGRAHV